jgi:hypothetical protein
MLAGSDTTSTALANAVFYLNIHPECLVRLRAELETAGTDPDLGEMRYLQAVINETLRLQPAMPNGVQRVAPHGGGPVDVADQFVFLLAFSTSDAHHLVGSYPQGRQYRSRPGAVSLILSDSLDVSRVF